MSEGVRVLIVGGRTVQCTQVAITLFKSKCLFFVYCPAVESNRLMMMIMKQKTKNGQKNYIKHLRSKLSVTRKQPFYRATCGWVEETTVTTAKKNREIIQLFSDVVIQLSYKPMLRKLNIIESFIYLQLVLSTDFFLFILKHVSII